MLIANGRLVTNDQDKPFFENGAVVVQGDTVAAVGDFSELKVQYPNEEVFDVKGRLIMPGMINAHTHIYSAYARGMGVSRPTRNFFEILENLWWSLDRTLDLEDCELNAYTTIFESIRNGVTTIFDHHSSPNHCTGSLFAIAEAAKAVGIRGSYCYECSDRDGLAILDREIAENIDFMKAYNNDEQDMIKGLFGLHASFTLSQESMYKVKAAKEGVAGGYHVHVAEGIADQYDSLKKYGKTVVERLFDLGMLGPETLAIHCVHAGDLELSILKDTDTSVVHNPMSNMGNAVGVTPVVNMLQRGIRLGLGTDAYTNDMFESVKVAKILQSSHLADPTVGFGQALAMQFDGNPAICRQYFKKDLGVLRAGSYADLITVDYKTYTPFSGNNWGGHVIFGMAGRLVNDTMINGRWVMQDRNILTVDEEKIMARSTEKAKGSWKQL